MAHGSGRSNDVRRNEQNRTNRPTTTYDYDYSSYEVPDYSEYLEQLSALTAEANKIAEQQVTIGQEMADISKAEYDWWVTNYKPREQELLDQADRGLDVGYAADVAGNRMEQAASATQQATDLYYQRLGVDPNDPTIQRIRTNLELQKTAAIAGAKNNARTSTADASEQMKLAVAGMGSGLFSGSVDMFQQSAGTLGQSAAAKVQGGQGVGEVLLSKGRLGLAAQQAQNSASLAQQSINNQWNYNQALTQANRYAAIGNFIGSTVGTGLGFGMSRLGASGAATKQPSQADLQAQAMQVIH